LQDSYNYSFAIRLRWVFAYVTNGMSPNKWLKLFSCVLNQISCWSIYQTAQKLD